MEKIASLLYGLGWVVAELAREEEARQGEARNPARADFWYQIRQELLGLLNEFKEEFGYVPANRMPQG